MNAQKTLARNSRKVESSMNIQNDALINYKEESKFVGYDKLGLETEVTSIMKDNQFVDSSSDECYIFLKENPFYAESGGQVADSGYLKNDKCKLEVLDVIKAPNGQHMVYVKVLEGTVTKGDKILTHVSKEKRLNTMKNHSSVHLLQKSLQELLGDSVHQAGSKVDDKMLRFDFNYHGRLSDELILKVEDLVNQKIQAAYETKIEYMSLDEAKKKGAMALFSDKYGSVVRVVTIGDSVELCAGTHVINSKDINKFAIASVENKGSDTFRVIAATDTNIEEILGEEVSKYNEQMLKLLDILTFDSMVIEQIKSYGMAVGESIFETCVWSGRFMQKVIHNVPVNRIPRQEVKLHICKSSKAKDANVIQALIDRFAGDVPNKGKGTKKDPGFFYGFAKDVWQAFAVAVTYYDKYINNEG